MIKDWGKTAAKHVPVRLGRSYRINNKPNRLMGLTGSRRLMDRGRGAGGAQVGLWQRSGTFRAPVVNAEMLTLKRTQTVCGQSRTLFRSEIQTKTGDQDCE